MKKFVYLIISIINAVITAIYIALSPNNIIPSHYNTQGIADAYSSKWFVMAMPCVLVVICLIYLIYEVIADKMHTDRGNRKVVNRIFLSTFLTFAILFWYLTIVCVNSVNMLNVTSFVNLVVVFLGVIIAVTSDVFPKLKQNNYVGFRTASTLSDEKVWKKTHKIGGYCGVIGGIVTAIIGLAGLILRINSEIVLISGVAVILISTVLIPLIYSRSISKTK